MIFLELEEDGTVNGKPIYYYKEIDHLENYITTLKKSFLLKKEKRMQEEQAISIIVLKKFFNKLRSSKNPLKTNYR